MTVPQPCIGALQGEPRWRRKTDAPNMQPRTDGVFDSVTSDLSGKACRPGRVSIFASMDRLCSIQDAPKPDDT